jgi:hypothetical protein
MTAREAGRLGIGCGARIAKIGDGEGLVKKIDGKKT